MSDKHIIKQHLTEYVLSITGKKGSNYICPICGSGTGPKGTAAFSVYGDGNTKWQCKSGKCSEAGQRGGDILDLIGIMEGIPDYSARMERARQMFGYERKFTPAQKKSKPELEAKKQEQEELPDFTQQYKEWNKNLKDCTYTRGISFETLNRFNVGFCPDWVNPKAKQAPPSPRLIIPMSASSYIARATDGNRYKAIQAGSKILFNVEALKADEPVFVTEGEFDALSIIDAGGQAVGLSTTGNASKFIEQVKETPPAYPLCLALDNDKAGRIAEKQITDELDKLGISYYRVDFAEGNDFKDPNEVLMNTDILHLIRIVEKAKEQAIEIGLPEFEAKKAEYLKTSVYAAMEGFRHAIEESKTQPAISTGFKTLDFVLNGGMRSGFYVLGAESSAGKTALALQIADNIAKAGRDVLIISLEMARHELMARSISRESYLYVKEKGYETHYAKTELGISEGYRYEDYSPRNLEVVKEAMERYSEYNSRIYIHEGVGNIGVAQIREIMKNHFYFTGTYPILFVDFLQILAPDDVRASDKQNTDKAVLELKRMSRDYNTPVIAISSFNRASYGKEVVDMASFKESGGIEYTADALFGLVLNGETGNERDISLHVLKNRKGMSSNRKRKVLVNFKYNPIFNHYEEVQYQQVYSPNDML